eukprot:TRINITY_DN7128_c0_g1_i2.p1 TRINITY_DN7128_c0_g1~~TRINITY_DN7128_c0_g1_i2.p1  ORF type:complete len:126 (-),score=32.46 TRINITY_DN7128_c0_g1_i2:221-598(-)
MQSTKSLFVVLVAAVTLLRADALSLSDVSTLGLQRSVKLQRVVVAEEPELSASDISVSLKKDILPETPQLSDVSLLGLQRSSKIVRKAPAKPLREEQAAATEGGASLLGLQRSTYLSKGPSVTED